MPIGDASRGDTVTGKTRVPVTRRLRDDLAAAMEDAGLGLTDFEYRTQGVVRKQTVGKLIRGTEKKWITWEQWRPIADAVGLDAEDYLPAVEAEPEDWLMPDQLRRAVARPEDRRLLERALERLVKANTSGGDPQDPAN